MPIFTYIKIGIVSIIVIGVISLGVYINNITNENRTLQSNNSKLQQTIQIQSKLVEHKEEELIQIKQINKKYQISIKEQTQKINDLRTKFNETQTGDKRDLGKLAIAKPGLIQKIINSGTKNVGRCIELQTGAEPYEGEKNAECQESIDSYFNM